jgi:DNA-directed RNA polymerase specialized sigma24 family protein
MSMTPSRAAFGPDLRDALVAMVRRRVPPSEVDDIVQATLTEAIESPHAPADSEALRRWIFGVAKNKVVDYHRRAGRLKYDLPDLAGAPAPHAEADLLRWAERHLPPGEDAQKTLDWMLREGEGERLESIAASERLPAPRVRQRVSRLRRHFKTHWQREVAVLAALGVIVSAVVFFLRRPQSEPIAADSDGARDPLAAMWKEALARCEKDRPRVCLDRLDAARRLDPAGDAQPEVRRARAAAEEALAPAPTTLPPEEAPAPAPVGPETLEKKAPQRTSPSPKPTAAPTGTPRPPGVDSTMSPPKAPAPQKRGDTKTAPVGKPTYPTGDLGPAIPQMAGSPAPEPVPAPRPQTNGPVQTK